MKRIILGVVLDIIATIGLMLFIVLPSVAPIDTVPGMGKLLQDVLCTDSELINVERYSYEDSEGTSYSANFYCTYETRTRDVTGQAMLLGIGIFTIPLLISIALFISGGVALSKQRRDLSNSSYESSDGGFSALSSGEMSERETTTERLRVLKRACDEGLISEMEYNTKRQEILREM